MRGGGRGGRPGEGKDRKGRRQRRREHGCTSAACHKVIPENALGFPSPLSLSLSLSLSLNSLSMAVPRSILPHRKRERLLWRMVRRNSCRETSADARRCCPFGEICRRFTVLCRQEAEKTSLRVIVTPVSRAHCTSAPRTRLQLRLSSRLHAKRGEELG